MPLPWPRAKSGSHAREGFQRRCWRFAKLRGPVDIFFDKVLVNDEDGNVRANRLALLDQIRAATRQGRFLEDRRIRA